MKRIKYFTLGVIVTLVISVGIIPAIAVSINKQVNAQYNDIKIVLDGREITPKDANGNIVEPFIIDGTTYLPVRAVAEAFGKDVGWDGATSTVTIGARSYDWLDQIGYVDYKSSRESETKLTTWEPGNNDVNGNIYSRGLLFYLDYGYKVSGTVDVWQEVSYSLSNKYSRFHSKLCTAKYGLWEGNSEQIIVELYLDGVSAYRSPPITNGIEPIDIDIDVSGSDLLTIKVYTVNATSAYVTDKYSAIGLVDARLSRE